MNQNNEQNQASVQNVSSTKETFKRLILRMNDIKISYDNILLINCIII